MTGCSSSGDGVDSNGVGPESGDTNNSHDQTAQVDITGFSGTWRSVCGPYRIAGIPDEDQPDAYTQSTLTLDAGASTYSDIARVYTDVSCSVEDPDRTAPGSSGQVQFDGTTVTASGLEASVVRYISDGGSPDLVGLLHRDGDVLYREKRESTLIDNAVPTELALTNPWQLVE